jgi:hypothetical protein
VGVFAFAAVVPEIVGGGNFCLLPYLIHGNLHSIPLFELIIILWLQICKGKGIWNTGEPFRHHTDEKYHGTRCCQKETFLIEISRTGYTMGGYIHSRVCLFIAGHK